MAPCHPAVRSAAREGPRCSTVARRWGCRRPGDTDVRRWPGPPSGARPCAARTRRPAVPGFRRPPGWGEHPDRGRGAHGSVHPLQAHRSGLYARVHPRTSAPTYRKKGARARAPGGGTGVAQGSLPYRARELRRSHRDDVRAVPPVTGILPLRVPSTTTGGRKRPCGRVERPVAPSNTRSTCSGMADSAAWPYGAETPRGRLPPGDGPESGGLVEPGEDADQVDRPSRSARLSSTRRSRYAWTWLTSDSTGTSRQPIGSSSS